MFRCLSKAGSSFNKISHSLCLTQHKYDIGESKGIIITDIPEAIDEALKCIKENRRLLYDYIEANPQFERSLKPLKIETHTCVPFIVKLMTEASDLAGVGPMAAVAGVLADLAAVVMIQKGANVAIIENGGEIALHSERPIIVSVGAGNNYLSERIGFKVTSFPCGIATSSGRHSHAFSLGDADAVTVFADNAGLADAVATAAANKVIGNPGEDVKAGIDVALAIKGVHGALVIRDDNVSMGGILPQIISIEANK